MDAIVRQATAFKARALQMPPDKAVCQRLVLGAALARGETRISPWPASEDCQRTLGAIQALGVRVRRRDDAVEIDGYGGEDFHAPDGALDCGESGTTLRLLAGCLAGQPFVSRLAAAPSLSRRPMRRIVEPLSRMGARIEGATGPEDGREIYPPLVVSGRRPLRAIRYEMPVASAQVKSAILFAGLAADGPTTIVERAATRDHTERLLCAYGATVRTQGREVVVEPGALQGRGPMRVPGDFSSAAFFLVAACCVPGAELAVTGVGLNPTRIALLLALERMGASVVIKVEDAAWEPVGTIRVTGRPLRGIEVAPEEVPSLIDELPILMVAAACAEGASCFRGIGELRVKETDRITSMVNGLQRLGARVRVTAPDTVDIDGGTLSGAVVDSAGDHRTAMSLAIAGLAASGETTINGVECVSKSFPDFFRHLQALVGSTTVKTVDKGGSLC